MEIKDSILRRVESLEQEIGYIKRDLLHIEGESREKTSLFGSIRGGDITDEMVEDKIILKSGELMENEN